MLPKKTEQMLFILGHFLKETNKNFEDKPLEISMSKADFIDIIMKLAVISKKERAVYKNLENLEKNNYIVYDNKDLKLAKKGYSIYSKINREIESYKRILGSIETNRIFGIKENVQTKFK